MCLGLRVVEKLKWISLYGRKDLRTFAWMSNLCTLQLPNASGCTGIHWNSFLPYCCFPLHFFSTLSPPSTKKCFQSHHFSGVLRIRENQNTCMTVFDQNITLVLGYSSLQLPSTMWHLGVKILFLPTLEFLENVSQNTSSPVLRLFTWKIVLLGILGHISWWVCLEFKPRKLTAQSCGFWLAAEHVFHYQPLLKKCWKELSSSVLSSVLPRHWREGQSFPACVTGAPATRRRR